MTVSTTLQPAQSAIQRETAELIKQLTRLGNFLLNNTFDLSVKGSQRRKQTLISIFVMLGVIITLSAHSLEDWSVQIGNLFRYFFNITYALEFQDTPARFFEFTFGAILSPRTLRYLPVFILPFMLALQRAAIYLADIFELDDVSVARDFILHVALLGARKKLTIKNGDVAEKDINSPIFQIGGPGKVVVELDSVAVFEKPDGRPHIIDSTKASNNILDGFERFRGAIDLRDQFIEFSEKEKNSMIGRSLDGMLIKATDVRLLYRIHRDNRKPTLECPHPYQKDSVYHLIYNEGRLVLAEGMAFQKSQTVQDVYKRSPTGLQMGAIETLIRGELGKFMSKHKLTRYLASHGLPEFENARDREETIKAIRRLVADPDDPEDDQELSPPPEFEPREKITSLFTEFTSEFPKNAKDRGVELHWIGVGTWKPPNEIILEKHIEAWRISLENLGRGGENAIKALSQDTKMQKKILLIRDVPLARHHKAREDKKDRDFIFKDLLFAYREQLVKTKELLEESERPVPEEISYAINYLDSALNYIWVGKGDVPPKTPISEEIWYELLLQITGNDRNRVESLIEEERKANHGAERRELIRRAIIRLLTVN
jgi:hypothetical protein